MIPEGQCMILAPERTCEKLPIAPSSNAYPPNRTNYTAIVTSAASASICMAPDVGAIPDLFTSLPDAVREVINIGPLRDLGLSGFLVEGKLNLITTDIPRVVTVIYACAKRLGYGVGQVANNHCTDSL